MALQISSNPHNEDNLTDLTIIMGVPPAVRAALSGFLKRRLKCLVVVMGRIVVYGGDV